MKWFEGSINEAVATSKSRKAIFVVFVGGNDDASVQVSQAIESSEISSRLEQDSFVAVKIESGSENYRFFAQIYQLVPVPSVFFIGETGSPLEIVAGSATASELGAKIDEVLAKSGKIAAGSSLSFIESEKKSAENAAATVTTTEGASLSSTQGDSSTKKEEKAAELSHEEKVRRAQELMELQKKQRVEEEMRKEKEREIERRKREREVQEMRLKQRDLEIKQSLEERLREKAEDAAARERVRQQIAQDKLMRKEREQALQQNSSQQQPEKQVKTPSSSSSEASVARIQFRLPSGSTHMGQFEPLSTLGSLRDYVVMNIELPFQQFSLSTSFPRRDLLPENDNKTLSDLGLVPTSVILILPLRNPNAKAVISSSEDMGFLSRIIWALFTPIIGLYNYVLSYFYGPNRSPDRQQDDAIGSSESATNAGGNGPSMQQPSGLHRRNVGGEETKVVRTQGNIHRLHSSRDDNDENNTWNGNSTQQM
ncbi:UBX domain-containing protein 4 [Belonocnema kinseyi]|uniref:UBX domain-containing protein 4 n=1 Tax=Belonocnema kinseyi TaxID=2817044 RepID=UPI00143D0DDC|nr:UBX domain-containing protein 4 [Belonocnema kinseyi]